MDSLTHLDLCSGIGGFHLAAEWAGFETVGFSEIEPYCCKLLAEKWPGIKNYGDLRRADFSGLRERIAVVSAGVPCQPASLAGKRRGKEDDRWLWEAVLDVVGTVEPAWCIFENPPGILTLDEFGGVLLRLESLGYQIRMFSVPANAVGAKHRRQRVFVVAHSEHERRDGWADERRTETGARASTQFGGTGGNSEAVANAECVSGKRDGCARADSNGTSSRLVEFGAEPEALADADGAGLEENESRQSRQCPSIVRSGGPLRFRLTESPLCRAADGIRNRSHRLKALGNSVVPQQAYPFFAAIAQVMQ